MLKTLRTAGTDFNAHVDAQILATRFFCVTDDPIMT